MAKKKTIIEENIPDNTIPGVDGGEFSFADTDSDLILERIKGQYGGSRVAIKVYKIVAGHKPIFQFESNEHVSETQLQTYGGGLYHLRFFVEGIHKHTEEIEVAEKPLTPDNQPRSAADVQAQMYREQAQFNRELLMAVLARNGSVAPSAPTPMAEIATMWGLIHGMNPNSGGGFEKLLEVFKTGIELGSTKGGAGEMDWKTALISTAKELAPGILQIAGAAKGVDMANTNGNGNGGGTQGLIAATPEAILRSGLTWIKPRILSGLPVGLAIDWVIGNANDPQVQPFLAQALTKEFQDLVNADNEVANEPYNTWLRQFLTTLKEQFKTQTTEEQPDADEETGS